MPQVRLLFILLGCLLSPYVFSQERGLESDNRLFHIERSKNRNLVCYDVNLTDGVLDGKHPLDVYWVNQEDHPGRVNGLSAIEKKFAYGYKVVSKDDEPCRVMLSAYPGRELTIREVKGQYICTIQIQGEEARLQKLYVKAKESNSLSVEYVELTGLSLDNGQVLTEQVKNKKQD